MAVENKARVLSRVERLGMKRALIYVGFFLLAAITQIPCIALARESVVVTVPREGCRARDRSNQPLTVSVWKRDQYPSDGGAATPDIKFYGTQATLAAIGTGYYWLHIFSEHCWENNFPFAVITGHNRHILTRTWAWVRKPGTDYLIWYGPSGALAGPLQPNQSSPQLIGRSHTYTPVIENDRWFYFDDVPIGRYDLRVQTRSKVSHEYVTIVKNQVLTVER